MKPQPPNRWQSVLNWFIAVYLLLVIIAFVWLSYTIANVHNHIS